MTKEQLPPVPDWELDSMIETGTCSVSWNVRNLFSALQELRELRKHRAVEPAVKRCECGETDPAMQGACRKINGELCHS